ncbi:hypothetical protein GCM10007415_11750 [Parapedobacter pyrenivorans]|uniref:Tetratricopeptide repeat-containing protein n=1 Tax=Parapedobacter pyrenivorans TaxID=1305674 RepID=A0A917HJ62_9SPHI|nr:tetratricopeptide repeat protein [Parapedobacter pyrenivorans]GGG80874.1 hypothetical protein GCM10007415_11750 [Parapedobacter pyrenivorans]
MPEKYDVLIDAYLTGKLEGDELHKVEKLRAEDPVFREELQFRQQAAKAFARNEHERLKSRLQSLTDEEQSPETTISGQESRLTWWYAAASILLIGTIGLFYWSNQPVRTSSELYSIHFTPYPNIVMPIVREATDTDVLTRAYANYEKGNYERAYILFAQLIGDGNADAETVFYQALSAMQLNRYKEATTLLSTYLDSPGTKLMRQAQWYLSLAYIKMGETESAINLLEQLAVSNGYKQTEAKVLIKELNP